MKEDEVVNEKPFSRGSEPSSHPMVFGVMGIMDWSKIGDERLTCVSNSGLRVVRSLNIEDLGEFEIHQSDFLERRSTLLQLLSFDGCGSPEAVVCGWTAAVFHIESVAMSESFFLLPSVPGHVADCEYRSKKALVELKLTRWEQFESAMQYLPTQKTVKSKLFCGGTTVTRTAFNSLMPHERVYVQNAKSSGPKGGTLLPCYLASASCEHFPAVVQLGSATGRRQFDSIVSLACSPKWKGEGKFAISTIYEGTLRGVGSVCLGRR